MVVKLLYCGMDECKKRLAEIGITEVLIASYVDGTGAGYSYNGNPKPLHTCEHCSARSSIRIRTRGRRGEHR